MSNFILIYYMSNRYDVFNTTCVYIYVRALQCAYK